MDRISLSAPPTPRCAAAVPVDTQYLGLRLFAHPWDEGTADFRKGPGDGLADALADPCLSDLFRGDGASRVGSGGGGGGGGRGAGRGGNGGGGADKVADTLRKVGALSDWMRLRAAALLKEERQASGRRGVGDGGSCAFNLTLINRMESSGTKRDLKPDPLFAMGKCSVSWHADSCLQDFSTIGTGRIGGSGCVAVALAVGSCFVYEQLTRVLVTFCFGVRHMYSVKTLRRLRVCAAASLAPACRVRHVSA